MHAIATSELRAACLPALPFLDGVCVPYPRPLCRQCPYLAASHSLPLGLHLQTLPYIILVSTCRQGKAPQPARIADSQFLPPPICCLHSSCSATALHATRSSSSAVPAASLRHAEQPLLGLSYASTRASHCARIQPAMTATSSQRFESSRAKARLTARREAAAPAPTTRPRRSGPAALQSAPCPTAARTPLRSSSLFSQWHNLVALLLSLICLHALVPTARAHTIDILPARRECFFEELSHEDVRFSRLGASWLYRADY